MAATLSTAARDASVNAIVDLVDAGTANPTGRITITTAGGTTTLVVLDFSNPAFGGGSSGVATANAIANGTVTASGTAAEAIISDRDAATVISGLTVGTSGSDINFGSVNFQSGDTIGISSLTVTMPAS